MSFARLLLRNSWWFAVGLAGAVLPWGLAAAGAPLPRRLAQAVVAAALLALAAATGRAAARALRGETRATKLALAALLPVALAVHFVGLSFEVGHGYYRDEGIYRAAAERINAGALLPQSFIYGHLPYYLAAWSLWFHGLFPRLSTAVVAALTGLTDEAAVSWMWIRAWSGLAGALTALPVFALARRVVRGGPGGGPQEALATGAGLLAGLLITASTLFNEVTHVFISDVPAAFFAALCVAVAARLLERERVGDYLWAGIASGLAAGCKYPAGVVAVAVAAVWLRWRIVARRGAPPPAPVPWGLAIAAAASLGAFLLVMPAFFVHARGAFAGEGRDVLFGVRQYAEGGWIGVEKDSNAAWYAAQIRDTFGVGALVAGLAGLVLLDAAARRRWLWLATFPLAYAALLASMSMVVKRNLLPLLPPAAALVAAAAAGLVAWLGGRAPRRRLAAAAAVAVAALAEPLVGVALQDLRMVRPGTREVLAAWARDHLPPGAGVVKESYTPRLEGPFAVLQTRFAARVDPAELASGRYELVLLADTAYARFLDPANLKKEHQRIYAERYRALLALPEVFGAAGGSARLGPGLSLRRLPGARPALRERHFGAADAAFAGGGVERLPGGGLRFGDGDAIAAFKDTFAAGDCEVALEADGGGMVRVADLENRTVFEGPPPARFTLAAPARLFIAVRLERGGVLRGVRVAVR